MLYAVLMIIPPVLTLYYIHLGRITRSILVDDSVIFLYIKFIIIILILRQKSLTGQASAPPCNLHLQSSVFLTSKAPQ